MNTFRIVEGPKGLRMEEERSRAPGSTSLTWMTLFGTFLEPVRAYVLYFPSRFELPVDAAVSESLAAFGKHTPATTSVNIWDGGDPEFGRVLALFGSEQPPALVFVAGGLLQQVAKGELDSGKLWAAMLTDQHVLADRAQLAPAANALHELVVQSDPAQIAEYVRTQKREALVDTLGHLAGGLRDQVLKLKPKLVLPGGISLQLG